jgi:hypothetical protein
VLRCWRRSCSWASAGSSTSSGGQLGPGHHIATDSKGNIYIAQTSAGLQKLNFKGMAPSAQ